MVTVFVYAVLAIVVVAALVALAVLVLPGTEELAAAVPDRTPWALPPERAMTGPDVGRLRLPVTLRGYRFAETDAVLDRLGEEIAYRDSVIATLRSELDGRLYAGLPAADPAADPEAEVLAVVDDDLDGADDDLDGADELVELGETPEETEGDDETRIEVVEGVTVVETDEGPRVVALDDEFPEFDGSDDLPPRG